MDYSKYSTDDLKAICKKIVMVPTIIAISCIAIGVLILLICLEDYDTMFTGVVLFIISFVITMAILIPVNIKTKPIRNELSIRQQADYQQKLKNYDAIKPSNCNTIVTVTGLYIDKMNPYKLDLLVGGSYYIWKNEAILNFLPIPTYIPGTQLRSPVLDLVSIPISDILYYESTGELYHENKISGGGGQRVSLIGATVGNALGGPAGAVLLGNKGANSIKSRDITHDTRVVTMRLPQRAILNFSYQDYNTLKLVIPEKDSLAISNNEPKNDIILTASDEILKYKQMLDEGIITEDEFKAMKKKLLGL